MNVGQYSPDLVIVADGFMVGGQNGLQGEIGLKEGLDF